MRTFPLMQCPTCGGESSVDQRLTGTRGDQVLRRCTACDLVFAPEYADWADVYTEGYLTGDSDFGNNIASPEWQEMLDFICDKRLRIMEKFLGGPGSLLDVGCGSGEFLRNARRRGWAVAGAEPVAESAELARVQGLDVRPTRVEDAGFEPRSFDVVSATHVLEHMPDATGFLRAIQRWARPGGHVVVEVPNYHGTQRRRMGTDWIGLRPLEHLAHFTPATLARTFELAGLEPVTIRSLGYLWERQGLGHMLADLGQERWRRPLARLSRSGEVHGQPMRIPTAPVRGLLRTVQAAYDVRKRGLVLLGFGRVP